MNLHMSTTTDAFSGLQQSNVGADKSCLLLYMGMKEAKVSFLSFDSQSNSSFTLPSPAINFILIYLFLF